jgi:serine/threonine protein kinase
MGGTHSNSSRPLASRTSVKKNTRPGYLPADHVEISQRMLVYTDVRSITEGAQLGKGTFGQVYLVQERGECDSSLSRKVAMKKPCKDPEHDSVKNERFILASLDHPNIIRMYGFAISSIGDSSVTYQLCEYCTEGELFQVIASKGPLAESVARSYFFQIMSALNYLHCVARIVHRDLKPENILVTNGGTAVKICDFGTAVKLERVGRSSKAGGRIGSLSYAAPEVYRDSLADFSSDIWSAGVVLYVMFCAASPFRISGEDDGEKKAVERVKRGDYNKKRERYRDMPSGPKKLIQKILQLDPTNRPIASQILSDPWLVEAEPSQSDISTKSSSGSLAALAEDVVPGTGLSRSTILKALCAFTKLDIRNEKLCWLGIANQLGTWEILDRVFSFLDKDHDGIVSVQDLSMHYDQDMIQDLGWFSYTDTAAALLKYLGVNDQNVRGMIRQVAPFGFDAARPHVSIEYDEFYSLIHNNRKITDTS